MGRKATEAREATKSDKIRKARLLIIGEVIDYVQSKKGGGIDHHAF